MIVDKAVVARKLREHGDYDRAQAAACALPRQVDTDRDARLLHSFDVSVAELEESAELEKSAPAGRPS